jgi:GntR family transcriptional regulator, galactonate operon transcriptional repressor
MRPKTQKLHVQLAEQLSREIVSERLAAGDVVPSEPTLVAEFEVSKTVVRETLQLLAAAGMLNIQHGKRTVVNPVEQWNILSPIVQEAYRAEGLAGPMVQELFEVRLMLEPQAAKLTAERAAPTELEEIQRLVDEMGEAVGRKGATTFLEHDRSFHAAILGRGASNRVLHAILRDIHALFSTSWALTKLTAKQQQVVLEQHRKIAEAMVRRDGEAAAEAMREHLLWAAKTDRAQARRGTQKPVGGRRAA